MNENKITLYFRDDEPESVFAYTILSQLGRRKSKVVTQMISGLAEKYGVSDIQDLTLRQLAELKKQMLSDFGIPEKADKIPVNSGKSTTRARKPATASNKTKHIPASKSPENGSETIPEGRILSEAVSEEEKPVIPASTVTEVTQTEQNVSVVQPVSVEEVVSEEAAPVETVTEEPVADVTEEDDAGYVNEDLLSQLGAFYGG